MLGRLANIRRIHWRMPPDFAGRFLATFFFFTFSLAVGSFMVVGREVLASRKLPEGPRPDSCQASRPSWPGATGNTAAIRKQFDGFYTFCGISRPSGANAGPFAGTCPFVFKLLIRKFSLALFTYFALMAPMKRILALALLWPRLDLRPRRYLHARPRFLLRQDGPRPRRCRLLAPPRCSTPSTACSIPRATRSPSARASSSRAFPA